MTVRRIWRAFLLTTATAVGLAGRGPAEAQPISLNYESLSSMEEPLAIEIGDVTFVLTGLVDARSTVDTEGDDDTDTGLIGNFQVNARTQLPNRLLVDLSYFGQDASGPTTVFRTGDDYTDNAALSVGSYWGTVLGGNVSGTIREQTRRLRGAGNAALAFDDFLGAFEDWSAGYTGRFGPWVVGAVVDEDGGLDLGAIFQRPAGTRDWRLTRGPPKASIPRSAGPYGSIPGASGLSARSSTAARQSMRAPAMNTFRRADRTRTVGMYRPAFAGNRAH